MHRVAKRSMILMGLLFCATAVADDQKVYPGSACSPANSVVSHMKSSGFVRSTHSVKAGFDCPVVRDRVADVTPPIALVYVNDTSTETNVSCVLYTRSKDGTVISYGSGSTSPVSMTGTAELSLYPASAGALRNDYYHISCSLPTNSEVRSYYVYERPQAE